MTRRPGASEYEEHRNARIRQLREQREGPVRRRKRVQPLLLLMWIAGTIGLLIVAQSVFLLGGDRFVRHWDVTEYQEFYMALGLAALGWSARERLRARGRQPSAQLAVGARP